MKLAPGAFLTGQLEVAIAAHDQKVARLGQAIHSPGLPPNLGLWLIRLRERHPVAKVIETLRFGYVVGAWPGSLMYNDLQSLDLTYIRSSILEISCGRQFQG